MWGTKNTVLEQAFLSVNDRHRDLYRRVEEGVRSLEVEPLPHVVVPSIRFNASIRSPMTLGYDWVISYDNFARFQFGVEVTRIEQANGQPTVQLLGRSHHRMTALRTSQLAEQVASYIRENSSYVVAHPHVDCSIPVPGIVLFGLRISRA